MNKTDLKWREKYAAVWHFLIGFELGFERFELAPEGAT